MQDRKSAFEIKDGNFAQAARIKQFEDFDYLIEVARDIIDKKHIPDDIKYEMEIMRKKTIKKITFETNPQFAVSFLNGKLYQTELTNLTNLANLANLTNKITKYNKLENISRREEYKNNKLHIQEIYSTIPGKRTVFVTNYYKNNNKLYEGWYENNTPTCIHRKFDSETGKIVKETLHENNKRYVAAAFQLAK
jgi:exopolysaccharide biosynthesis predicted pyruvyltransferase EpsI